MNHDAHCTRPRGTARAKTRSHATHFIFAPPRANEKEKTFSHEVRHMHKRLQLKQRKSNALFRLVFAEPRRAAKKCECKCSAAVPVCAKKEKHERKKSSDLRCTARNVCMPRTAMCALRNRCRSFFARSPLLIHSRAVRCSAKRRAAAMKNRARRSWCACAGVRKA